MTNKPYILVFDHGTTSIRACLMNRRGEIVARDQQQFEQIYPKPGWVEHNADTLWQITLPVAEGALKNQGATWQDVAAIGLTNQRETVILWDVETGKAIHNAIVWQCRRTSGACETLKQQGHSERITQKTGLVVDPYFSASKIQWLLDTVPDARVMAEKGRLRFGTVDTWILWHLSGGKLHVTDTTNASRTMLYDIHRQQWDPELLGLFGVSPAMLPEVQRSNVVYGSTDPTLTGDVAIPLAGMAGDQQAALFGQKCWTPGTAKSTYGTGAFLVMNTGDQPVHSKMGLLTTLACNTQGDPAYALEGAIFIAGAALEWLIKRLKVLPSATEADAMITSLPGNEGVYFVPAFTGLGAPYWNTDARGAIVGLTQDSGPEHLVRAAFEAMAYQTKAVLDAMQQEAGLSLEVLRVDGGVTRSNFLCQFLADILNVPVLRSDDPELTAKGAGYLAGLAVNFWADPEEIRNLPEPTERFTPNMDAETRERLFSGWQHAVGCALQHAKAPSTGLPA